MVIWFTGLSGSGKTTLSQYMHRNIKTLHNNTVYLDGDLIRKCFSMEKESDYTYEGRRKNAKRIHELSLILDKQKINVICAIQLIFNDIRSLNRKAFSIYQEIHITCSLKTIKERDTKSLYKLYDQKKVKNVIGIDIPYPKPCYYNFEINSDKNIDLTLSEIDDISNKLIPKLY